MYSVAGSFAKQLNLMHDFTSESDMLPPPLEGLVNQDVTSKPLISKSGRSGFSHLGTSLGSVCSHSYSQATAQQLA